MRLFLTHRGRNEPLTKELDIDNVINDLQKHFGVDATGLTLSFDVEDIQEDSRGKFIHIQKPRPNILGDM